MKEVRYFYVPDAAQTNELPAEEASHAVRVLRLQPGDSMVLMDGVGSFYDAHITMATAKRCLYEIDQTLPQEKSWWGRIHLAIAPTKMMERMEWMAEKATEVGFDALSLLDCRFSERRKVRLDRLEKIVVAATKQSRKPFKPELHDMESFHQFVTTHTSGLRCIAHCYNEVPREDLFDLLSKSDSHEEVTVMVGPEGDFSIDEVHEAVSAGYVSVSLGNSRLRTETAGLMAVAVSQMIKRKR
jgi:16S rRNA (uracil1498-N3)-methyltransferase